MTPPQFLTPPRKQHTVSRVVLRRFASNNRISVFDRESDAVYSKGPGGIFHTYLDKHDPWSAEERWGEIESHVPRVYKLIDERRLLDDAEAVDVLRDLLAMHWVRSPSVRVKSELIRQQVVDARVDHLSNETALLALGLRQQTGLVPGSDADLQWFNRRTHEQAMGNLQEESYSDSLRSLFMRAREMLGTRAVQIGYSRGLDFAIGDVPVVTMQKGHLGVGPHQGVALGDAGLILMPIDPHVVIALGSEPAEMDMNDDAVSTYNELQARGFIRWLGCRPAGAADAHMRRTMNARSTRP